MFVVFSWLHFLHLIILHNRYILNMAKFSEVLHFCWILLILAVSIISLLSFVLIISRVSQLMRSAASPLRFFWKSMIFNDSFEKKIHPAFPRWNSINLIAICMFVHRDTGEMCNTCDWAEMVRKNNQRRQIFRYI